MPTLTGPQVAKLLYDIGFRGEPLIWMTGIGFRESHYVTEAFNGDASTGDLSYGLFQVNMIGDLGPSRRIQFGIDANEELFDPAVNVRAALNLYNAGVTYRNDGLFHWGGYKGETGLQGVNIDRAREAVSAFSATLPNDRKYLSGYNANQRLRTRTELEAWASIKLIHPEVWRRHMAMMDAAYDEGVRLGPGGAGRTRQQQVVLYESRYDLDPDDLPPCAPGRGFYKGGCWVHVSGAAAAIPDQSYHQVCAPLGSALYALSLDMVGDMTWMDANLARFGLYNFDAEKWHTQPREVPSKRTAYDPARNVIKIIVLPPSSVPTPPPAPPVEPVPTPPTIPVEMPVLRRGSSGKDVYTAQIILRHACGQAMVACDARFGPDTELGVRNVQTFFKLAADGVIGPKTWAVLHMAVANPPNQTP